MLTYCRADGPAPPSCDHVPPLKLHVSPHTCEPLPPKITAPLPAPAMALNERSGGEAAGDNSIHVGTVWSNVHVSCPRPNRTTLPTPGAKVSEGDPLVGDVVGASWAQFEPSHAHVSL